LPDNWKVIIAPHKVDELALMQLKKQLNTIPHEYYSTFKNNGRRILIIDNIGLLSSIYQYADVAYVGGAFKTGLHNILEPSVYGIPVIFGKNYEKFSEAKAHINEGIAFSVKTSFDFIELMSQFEKNKDLLKNIKEKASHFMRAKKGATKLISTYCKGLLEKNKEVY